MIDSHAHLNDERFSPDRQNAIQRARAAGVSCILDIGDSVGSSGRSIELAEQHDIIFSAVGIHPHHAESGEGWPAIEKMLSHEKVIAVGETGLDYHKGFSEAGVQRELFESSLSLACRHNLPVIIHCRRAFDDVRQMVQKFAEARGVMHCFSGGADQAECFLELDFYISFAGNVTFPKADRLREAAAVVPLNRLLLETDCPYLAPQPVRGKRNEPAYISHIYDFVAKLRGISLTELAGATASNFAKLFRLKM